MFKYQLDTNILDHLIIFIVHINYGTLSILCLCVPRKSGGNDVTSAYTPGILSCTDFRTFWVSWDSNTIRVGHGDETGNDIIVQFVELQSVNVHFVGFSTGKSANGFFEYPLSYGR